VIVLIAWLSWPASGGKDYDTPEQAVVNTCRAAQIMGNYTPGNPAAIRIGWQEAGQPAGIGWTALVEHRGGGYAVKRCKYQHVTHG
jgi:hypothetical protein